MRMHNQLQNTYNKRRSRREKENFRNYISHQLHTAGWTTQTVSGGKWIFRSNNVITTNTQTPKVVLMGHYDTASAFPYISNLPQWLFGVAIGQIIYSIIIFIPIVMVCFIGMNRIVGYSVSATIIIIALLFYLFGYFPNPINKNDNTSGVISLLDISNNSIVKGKYRGKIMLVFTDNEEKGCLGSKVLKKRLRSLNYDISNAKIINLDCIGYGDKIGIGYTNDKSLIFAERLRNIFQQNNGINTEVNVLKNSSSDHKRFKEEGAVIVSRYKAPIWGPRRSYYIGPIHTYMDRTINQNGINEITNKVVQAITELCN